MKNKPGMYQDIAELALAVVAFIFLSILSVFVIFGFIWIAVQIWDVYF